MNGKRRPEYLYLSLGTALFGIVLTVLAVITMNSAASAFGSHTGSGEEQVIMRAQALAGGEGSSCAKQRIEADLYSLADYLITVFESPDYLLSCADDDQFARDLAGVVYGDADAGKINDISSMVKSNSRMYAVDLAVRSLGRSNKSTGNIISGGQGTVAGATVTDDFKNDGRTLMGISKASGTLQYDGDDIRADMLVDGSLCHGYLNLGSSTSGARDYELSWDTAESSPGEHDINILFRTGEGRSLIIPGGKVDIPEFGTISNDRASDGVLSAGSESSWYRFNCEDRDAYVNFAGMTDDIKVSLYDLCGNLLGENDLPGLSYEVLRGKAQDVAAVSEQTGIMGLSNCFYVRVSRGAACESPNADICYMMVQSPEAARYNGTYMAVTGREGDVVRLVDKDLQIYEDDISKVDILPLNGTLIDLTVKDQSGTKINIWPGFDAKTEEYAYYMKNVSRISVSAVPQEGYASSVNISIDGDKGSGNGGEKTFELKKGMNQMSCEVGSFTGEKKIYKIYILCGDDDGAFYENTLSRFPESYYSGLILLHAQHPQYVFTPYNTGIDFEEAVKVEDTGGRSLATNRYNPTYVKPDSKIYDAPDWMAVKPEVIRYYLDPRNFLSIERVFMFERQSYNPDYHTKEGVASMIKGTFMDTGEYNYADAILNAAKTSGVSPYLLASRILTEMGSNGQSKLAQGTVEGYEGYYNFYNIGSYGSTGEGGPVLNGAKFSRWGYEPDKQELTDKERAFLLPWDSRDKAITGGALWIASGYINNGQDTLYFQKFDVVDNGTALYDHQYAGNIMMAYSEGYRYYKSYLSTDQLGNTFEFIIPVYNNMPDGYGDKP